MRFILLLVLLFLTVGTDRLARPQTPPAQSQPPRPSSLQRLTHSHWYRASLRALEIVLGLATLAQVVIAIWGPFWPTAPRTEPSGLQSTETFSIPFFVSNDSIIFPIYDAKFYCNLYFIVFDTSSTLENVSAGTAQRTIAAGTKNLPLLCGTARHFPGTVVGGKISIGVEYKRKFLGWTWPLWNVDGPFIWDYQVKTWLRGDPIQ